MALDINGYNTDFNAFIKFAQDSFVTNDKTAVARFEVDGAPLGGRLIVAANPQFDKGWTDAELPKIARAARFLSEATGVDEFTAIEQLSTPGSKANRLMNYGGRFMDSAQNFADGLRLMDGFKATVTNPAMRRGISSIMSQTSILALTSLSNRATLPSTSQHKCGINSADLPGIEKMVSRDATSGKYTMMTTDKKQGEPIRYDLTVSEDGKSATLTVSEKSNLVAGAGKNDAAVYGTVKNTMSFQIDMTGEKPVITATCIAQEFDAA